MTALEEVWKMKKTVAVLVVLVCCWLVASVGSAICKGKPPRSATVTIKVDFTSGGSPTIDFGSKGVDPIPCIFRDSPITITVEFTGDAIPDSQELRLSNFIALLHSAPGSGGGSWFRDPSDLDYLTITEHDGAENWNAIESQVLVFTQSEKTHTIKLEGDRGGGGPHRLIAYRLEMAGPGTGNPKPINVAFDPPWGERP